MAEQPSRDETDSRRERPSSPTPPLPDRKGDHQHPAGWRIQPAPDGRGMPPEKPPEHMGLESIESDSSEGKPLLDESPHLNELNKMVTFFRSYCSASTTLVGWPIERARSREQ